MDAGRDSATAAGAGRRSKVDAGRDSATAAGAGRRSKVDAGRDSATAAGGVGHRRPIRANSAPGVPRRVSGPVRRTRPPSRPNASKPRLALVGRRTATFLRSLPDHALIDRLVRGRAWIPVLGLMLAGIVAMQVEVLKLGASVGRSIERGSALETRNQLLRASVASLSDESRIERLAAGMGMIMPAPGSAGFLSGTANGDLRQAIANIRAPDPAAFLTSQSSNGAIATTSIMSTADGSIVANPPQPAGASATGATAPQTAAPQTAAPQTAAPQPTASQPTPSQPTPTAAQQQQQQQTATTGG
jgi:hypothetical protein